MQVDLLGKLLYGVLVGDVADHDSGTRVEQDDLRNELAKVMDDARAMRIEFRRNNSPPQASTINQRITMPLVEIRDRVAEELAKLDKENPLAPIDRDPVPREYRELVRRYYEELGSGR